jgi:peptide/nickel transport system substrate-binding protein
MRKSTKAWALLAAALFASSPAAGEARGAAKTHYLRIADGTGDISTLNPHLDSTATLGFLSELTMAYLVRWGANNQPYPELATALPTRENGGISADGLTITYHLRRGVRWSDGAPFNADDVVFTTNAAKNPKNNEIDADAFAEVEHVDAPDPYTVIYHLKAPNALFLPAFFGSAGGDVCILPKHLLARYPTFNAAPYNALPVGIGPFRYIAWKRSDSVELEANPYYWRGAPRLQHISYKLINSRDTALTLLQTGEIDLWAQVPPAYIDHVEAIDNVTTIAQPAAYYSHADFNVQRPLVRDIRVREAIRYALDRPMLIRTVSHGHALLQESVVSPAVAIAPNDIPLVPFDPQKARALLEQAGWKVGPDGIRMNNGTRLSLFLPFYTGSAATDTQVEVMRSLLKDVGIEIDTRKSAPAKFFAPAAEGGVLYGSDWDMTFFSAQNGPGGDISSLFACDQMPPTGQNVLRFCDKALDALFVQFTTSYSVEVRKALLRQEVMLIVKEVPTIVLSVPEYGFSYNKTVTGFHPGLQTPFDQMMNVDI